jgi:hypothetical protein
MFIANKFFLKKRFSSYKYFESSETGSLTHFVDLLLFFFNIFNAVLVLPKKNQRRDYFYFKIFAYHPMTQHNFIKIVSTKESKKTKQFFEENIFEPY